MFGLSPVTSVYYLLDAIDFRPLSHSGQVTKVEIDKIRYLPGDTLKGSAVLQDVGGKGGAGVLNLYLEHSLADRVKLKSLPVTLAPAPQTLPFEVTLSAEELGYALVVEYVSADGADRSEAAEYFSVAANFQRVAIFGGGLATRDVVLDEDTIRQGLREARANYFNATEYFAWAEDDMVAMSPASEFWSSGQTQLPSAQADAAAPDSPGARAGAGGCHLRQIRHVRNARVGDGLPGSEQPPRPVRLSRGHVGIGQRRAARSPPRPRFHHLQQNPQRARHGFPHLVAGFRAHQSRSDPRCVRRAAEEMLRSIDMFGWDAVRWDGHPRGGGQCGCSGDYQPGAARQTQSLVRYFKEIVGAKYPNFAYGYNYLLIEPNKGYDWAREDFELDELCRGGGLLMNESMGNASAGWTFAQIAHILQVEGDLCRERGGYYLGISYAKSPRDQLIESALWAAGGCRPYNNAMTRAVRRYCTRYSQYTFDERLRRLAAPEKVLAPQAPTKLWWQPFVYETPLQAGKRQLVVNLLNLPQQEKRPPRDEDAKPKYEMLPGADPVTFALTLPAGVRAVALHLLDPQTLTITPLALNENRFEAPAVATWQVLIIDLAVDNGAPSLAALYGAPKTFGVPRDGLKDAERRA